MQLVDTHCHVHETGSGDTSSPTYSLWQRARQADPDQIIERARQNGVGQMICVGTSAADSRLAVEFVEGRPGCFASIGIHPHEAKDGQPALEVLKTLADKPKVVAVGECGLDYFYNHSPRDDQIEMLRAQLELAQAHNLPVIFHVREAFDDFWPIYDDFPGLRGVLHSFTDSQTNLDKALKRGLFIGLNGIMTFTRDPAQQAMARAVPLNKLVLETDAPYLTPVPHRGTINEPANTRVVAEFLAKLRGESLEELAAQTTQNARELFSIRDL